MQYKNGNTYCGPWRDGAPDTTPVQGMDASTGTKWFKGGDVYVGEWSRGGRDGFGVYTFAASEMFTTGDCVEVQRDGVVPTSKDLVGVVVRAQYRGRYVADQPHDSEGVLITFVPTPVNYSVNAVASHLTSSPPEVRPCVAAASTSLPSSVPIGVRSIYRGGFVGGRKEGTGSITMYDPTTGNALSSVVGGLWYRGKRVIEGSEDGSGARAQSSRPADLAPTHNRVLDGDRNPEVPLVGLQFENQFGAVAAALDGMGARMEALEARLANSSLKPTVSRKF
jgi:hypothetical protein